VSRPSSNTNAGRKIGGSFSTAWDIQKSFLPKTNTGLRPSLRQQLNKIHEVPNKLNRETVLFSDSCMTKHGNNTPHPNRDRETSDAFNASKQCAHAGGCSRNLPNNITMRQMDTWEKHMSQENMVLKLNNGTQPSNRFPSPANFSTPYQQDTRCLPFWEAGYTPSERYNVTIMNVGSILDIAINITQTIDNFSTRQRKLSLPHSYKHDKLDPSRNVFRNKFNSSTASTKPVTIHDIERKRIHTEPGYLQEGKHILFMNDQAGSVMEMSYNCTEKVCQFVEKASVQQITNLTDSLTDFVQNSRDILSVCLSILILHITRKKLLQEARDFYERSNSNFKQLYSTFKTFVRKMSSPSTKILKGNAFDRSFELNKYSIIFENSNSHKLGHDSSTEENDSSESDDDVSYCEVVNGCQSPRGSVDSSADHDNNDENVQFIQGTKEPDSLCLDSEIIESLIQPLSEKSEFEIEKQKLDENLRLFNGLSWMSHLEKHRTNTRSSHP
jgi:hypothetical protein